MIPYHNLVRKHNSIKSQYKDLTDIVYKKGQFFDGVMTQLVEKKLRELTGYKYCRLVSNGTAGLYTLATYYKSKGLDAVSLPRLTYRATHNAFLRAGYEVNFLDYNQKDLLAIEDDSDSLLVRVGLLGKQPCEVINNRPVIDDACQNWINSKSVHTKVISFDPTKIISSNGNGGAILTNDEEVFEYTCQFITNKTSVHGLNLRMSELESAYVFSQLYSLDDWMKRRREIMTRYKDAFKERLIYQHEDDHDMQKAVLIGKVPKTNRVETRRVYDDVAPELELFALPLYPELTDKEVGTIISTVLDYYKEEC